MVVCVKHHEKPKGNLSSALGNVNIEKRKQNNLFFRIRKLWSPHKKKNYFLSSAKPKRLRYLNVTNFEISLQTCEIDYTRLRLHKIERARDR